MRGNQASTSGGERFSLHTMHEHQKLAKSSLLVPTVEGTGKTPGSWWWLVSVISI